jgi:hypothetical protein
MHTWSFIYIGAKEEHIPPIEKKAMYNHLPYLLPKQT